MSEDKEKLSLQEKEELQKKYDDDIQEFTLMSDVFMSAVFEDKECAKVLLSAILEKDLEIIDIKTQYNIQNLQGRSVRLDIWAKDKDGKVYNVEVENTTENAVPERLRYNSSLIDAKELIKGTNWKELPDVYVIMITKTDIFGKNKPLYHIERTVKELDNKPLGDRSYCIYVNSKIQDDTELGKLMHDFHYTKAENIKNKTIAERVAYFKDKEKGEFEMCEIMEKHIKKAEEEVWLTANLKHIKLIMLKHNYSANQAMEELEIPKEEYPVYLELLGLKS